MDEATTLFARASLLESAERYDEAFATLEAANRAAGGAFDVAGAAVIEAERFARIVRDFSPTLLGMWRGRGSRTSAPVFVVGKPRSGSTLVEQILASHPDVRGMGENDCLPRAIASMGMGPFGWRAAPDYFERLAKVYLASMRQLGSATRRKFVDKSLSNFESIGFIALALPNATILHCVRDPLDCCLSAYRMRFTIGNELAFDLAEIGHSYVRYRRLMEHWAAVLPGRVVDVVYEDLVGAQERQTRWLVTEACSLPWNDRCLHFHENDRPVLTASADQVRQPIFTTSIGRWRNYEKHLGPLIEALGPYATR
jgi:hypothetical protein